MPVISSICRELLDVPEFEVRFGGNRFKRGPQYKWKFTDIASAVEAKICANFVRTVQDAMTEAILKGTMTGEVRR